MESRSALDSGIGIVRDSMAPQWRNLGDEGGGVLTSTSCRCAMVAGSHALRPSERFMRTSRAQHARAEWRATG